MGAYEWLAGMFDGAKHTAAHVRDQACRFIAMKVRCRRRSLSLSTSTHLHWIGLPLHRHAIKVRRWSRSLWGLLVCERVGVFVRYSVVLVLAVCFVVVAVVARVLGVQ
jgi:hypothetical protein